LQAYYHVAEDGIARWGASAEKISVMRDTDPNMASLVAPETPLSHRARTLAADTVAQHRQIDGKAFRTSIRCRTNGTDQESSERDADGRRLWETPGKRGKNEKEESAGNDASAAEAEQRSIGAVGYEAGFTG
jgi:hypothetical protein